MLSRGLAEGEGAYEHTRGQLHMNHGAPGGTAGKQTMGVCACCRAEGCTQGGCVCAEGGQRGARETASQTIKGAQPTGGANGESAPPTMAGSMRSGKTTWKWMYRLPFWKGRPWKGIPSSAMHLKVSGLMTSPAQGGVINELNGSGENPGEKYGHRPERT